MLKGEASRLGNTTLSNVAELTINDGTAHDGTGLKLFGQHAQCAYRFILGRIKVL